MKLSIVIPAKNEEKRINRTLKTYGSFFAGQKLSNEIEIIVVVNNTFDSTLKIISEYSKKYPFIKALETKYASGKGGAVSLGFLMSKGEYVSYIDADGSVSPSEVLKLYNFIKETKSSDGVIAERKIKSMTLKRHILSKFYNLIVSVLFDLPYKDTQCAVKIFKSEVAKNIARKLSNTGWTFDVNLLLVARKLNYKILEKEILWNEKDGSKFSLIDGLLRVPFELFSLKKLEIVETVIHLFNRLKTHKRKGINKKKLNVLILSFKDIKQPGAGGAEVYIHEIAKRLAKKHNIFMFTSSSTSLSDKDVIDGVNITRKGRGLFVYFYAFIYYMLYFRHDMDLVIDTHKGIPFFTPLYSNKPKILLVHHVHKHMWFDEFFFPLALLGYFLELYIMPLVYKGISVVTVSPSSLTELRKIGFDDKKTYISYPAIQVKLKKAMKKTANPTMLYLGRLKEYKRIEYAIRALKKLLPEFPKLRLMIAGEGDYEKKLISLVKKLNLIKHVDFLGLVSEEEKVKLMQKAWVFLMPSKVEGWGITVMEAGALGTPSVGTNVLGLRDSIVDSKTGFLSDSFGEFTSNIRRLLINPNMRNEMGRNSKNRASKFSWNSSAEIFEHVIEAVNSKKDESLLSNKAYPWEVALRAYLF
ncbi:hypothetical protein A3H26_03435 [candidate division WWE3 bacterium RIFCSPLOWO2_12_FULL_36_10]|uniref:Glycosyl transferase family 1 domain-containing protein n=1 Tax=candidate division WWE3 bacterium RIFCSPLOWO2_12_FULL_36_10 TaxID=1802630 RepID=A0A1F4VII4_UNCKA|nr:MAG: hypothetical protein A3H26_03435 [candidate division WWE3 bacterium RIFCSPLOWO2_12_FULL_36_10]